MVTKPTKDNLYISDLANQAISVEGFIRWAKKEYDKDPTTKVSVKFILECLQPSLITPKATLKGKRE